MKTINLDPNFVPFPEYSAIPYNAKPFPSGFEPHIKFDPIEEFDEEILVTLRVTSTDDIMKLMFLGNILKSNDGVNRYSLFISFLPFARQDRVHHHGFEPLSLKVMADMINMCEFHRVYIYDAHSDISCALIKNSRSISNHEFVRAVLFDKHGFHIVSPDAGAFKKVEALVEKLGYKDKVVSCLKARDWDTGTLSIEGMTSEDLHGADVYIVDDICDGGGTFILLSEYLKQRNVGKIYLIISAGIFSKGIDILRGHLDGIYVTNSFKDINDPTGFVKQITLCQKNMNIRF